MIKKLLPFCCLIVLLTACKDSSKNSEDSAIATIDLSKLHQIKKENKYLSDFAKDIEYIKLETKDECLLGEIETLHIGNKFVIVCNKRKNQAYAFKRDGKFIGKIGQPGRGPGEYQNVYKTFVFSDLKEIHLYCPWDNKILRFDYNLRHIDDINMDYTPTDIEVYQNKYYLCAYSRYGLKKNGGKELIVRDRISFAERKILLKRDITNYDLSADKNYATNLIKIQGTLYLARKISDKKYLYRVLKDEVKPVLLFKSKNSKGKFERLLLLSSFGDNIRFAHINEKHSCDQYYNLKTKKFSNWNIVNDIDNGPNLSIPSHFDGKYMGYLHSSNLAYLLKDNKTDGESPKRKCKFPERKKMFKEFALKGENDNPWLVVLTPKD